MFVDRARRTRRALRHGKVCAVEGTLKKEYIRTKHGHWRYYLVNGVRLRVASGGFEVPEGGARYVVYYLPDVNEVLSLEPASGRERVSAAG
ncbi:MAG: hypothetical protein ACYC8T_27795 [Myxococcaceae bacterium]